ncbi:MAG: hypothetical protein RLZZ584_3622 [Pseudomonadota bacterium]
MPASVQLALIATMAVWGVNLSIVKALTSTLDVIVVAAARMVVAAVTLSALLWWGREPLAALDRRQLLRLTLCAALMVYANQILFSGGLARSTATNGALIVATNPLLSGLIAAVVFHEALGWRRLLGIALGFAGVAVAVLNRQGAALGGAGLGDLMLLGSVLCFAVGGLAVQRLSRELSAIEIGWAVHLAGAVMLAAHAALDPQVALAPLWQAGARSWALIVFSAVTATALSAVIWNRAIARIGAARTAMAIYWVPIFGLAFAALFLGEPLNAWHGVGLAGVVAGSVLASRREAPAASARA